MKKTLLSIIAIATLSFGASAQIEMYVEGGTTDYSDGGVYTFYANGATEQHHTIRIENNSGSSQDWIVSRLRVDPPASYVDNLCWGHETDQFGGLCIDANSMDMTLYNFPSGQAVTVGNGEAGVLASYITPDENDPGSYSYRYYVGTSQNPYQDSMDVNIIMTPLTIEEQAPILTVGVKPNPATDYMVVTAEGAETATVRIIDVLGNVILNTKISGSKSIDVSEYRNGIYFVIVEANGTKINRKVFVRH